jgi:hypothetical protein
VTSGVPGVSWPLAYVHAVVALPDGQHVGSFCWYQDSCSVMVPGDIAILLISPLGVGGEANGAPDADCGYLAGAAAQVPVDDWRVLVELHLPPAG